MELGELEKMLTAVAGGKVSVRQAAGRLKGVGFHDLGFAKIDHHRALRKGFPEVIFCQNKAPDHVIAIIRQIRAHGETVFGTRADPGLLRLVKRTVPGMTVDPAARCFWHKSKHWRKSADARGTIVIASAGTADAPVVEEARRTVEILGHPCETLYDVGVAGIHRLFAHRDRLDAASVIIAVAGMEGALPSVIAGAVSCPVIGVPTSVGYGSHMGGLVPLFAMLNSCASGLTVVNIDNGFGAAFAAVMMNRK